MTIDLKAIKARADVPALVEEVERLREALEEIRDEALSRLPCDALGDGANPERQLGRKLDRIAWKADKAINGGGE